MTSPKDKDQALEQLAKSFVLRDQLRLREALKSEETYYRDIARTYLRNPFLRLTEEEAKVVPRLKPTELATLIGLRDAAARSKSPKHVVFCMPKSGSSFVQSALRHALELPFASLTSFAPPDVASYFGMNSREQELDELAIIRSVLTTPGGFVAQHHTRYSTYLGLQLNLFGMRPVVTVRNIPDCIVSFDDMMLEWRATTSNAPWVADAQFALPLNYPELDEEARYGLLAHSFGVWLINFYLSWKRAVSQGVVAPLVVRYEDHVLQPERLIEDLSTHAGMSAPQKARLAEYVAKPDKQRSRLNVGRRGRGLERVPEKIRSFLADYAALFAGELSDEDLGYLTP